VSDPPKPGYRLSRGGVFVAVMEGLGGCQGVHWGLFKIVQPWWHQVLRRVGRHRQDRGVKMRLKELPKCLLQGVVFWGHR